MDKKIQRIIKRRRLEGLLVLPKADAGMINHPLEEVKIRRKAEIKFFNRTSRLVYVIGFDRNQNRLVYAPERTGDKTFTTNVETIPIEDIYGYESVYSRKKKEMPKGIRLL